MPDTLDRPGNRTHSELCAIDEEKRLVARRSQAYTWREVLGVENHIAFQKSVRRFILKKKS